MVWKSKVTPRVKFFAWLILMDRLNTKDMLARRHFNVQPDNLCVLCSRREEETIQHLFFHCPFAKWCWSKIGMVWVQDDNIHRRIIASRFQASQRYFMEIFLIAAWELWKVRNRQVFDGIQATHARWLSNFKAEAALQAHRIKDCDRILLSFWLDSL